MQVFEALFRTGLERSDTKRHEIEAGLYRHQPRQNGRAARQQKVNAKIARIKEHTPRLAQDRTMGDDHNTYNTYGHHPS